MFKYLLFFVLFSPLIGIILVENGAYSISTAQFGHPNGAWLAYTVHCLVLLAVTFWTIAKKLGSPRKKTTSTSHLPPFVPLAHVILCVNVVFLALMLFGAGGIEVLMGKMEKSGFRASLNYISAIALWIRSYFVPSLLAYLSFVFTKSLKSPRERRLFGLNIAICALIGLNWGSKASPLIMLLPSILIIYWKISIRKVILLASIACLALIANSMLFDRSDEGLRWAADEAGDFSLKEAATFVAIRGTVLQGDVAWYIWDMYEDKQKLPPYFPTLYAAIGDRLFSLFSGIQRSDYPRWVKYHYDSLLTATAGVPLDEIFVSGHNVNGTIFSEGIIALGSPGYLLFSIFGGLCAGLSFNIIKEAIDSGSPIRAALSADYFCLIVFLWLNGGGITMLFHISVFLAIMMTYLLIRMCISLSGGSSETAPAVSVTRGRTPSAQGLA